MAGGPRSVVDGEGLCRRAAGPRAPRAPQTPFSQTTGRRRCGNAAPPAADARSRRDEGTVVGIERRCPRGSGGHTSTRSPPSATGKVQATRKSLPSLATATPAAPVRASRSSPASDRPRRQHGTGHRGGRLLRRDDRRVWIRPGPPRRCRRRRARSGRDHGPGTAGAHRASVTSGCADTEPSRTVTTSGQQLQLRRLDSLQHVLEHADQAAGPVARRSAGSEARDHADGGLRRELRRGHDRAASGGRSITCPRAPNCATLPNPRRTRRRTCAVVRDAGRLVLRGRGIEERRGAEIAELQRRRVGGRRWRRCAPKTSGCARPTIELHATRKRPAPDAMPAGRAGNRTVGDDDAAARGRGRSRCRGRTSSRRRARTRRPSPSPPQPRTAASRPLQTRRRRDSIVRTQRPALSRRHGYGKTRSSTGARSASRPASSRDGGVRLRHRCRRRRTRRRRATVKPPGARSAS